MRSVGVVRRVGKKQVKQRSVRLTQQPSLESRMKPLRPLDHDKPVVQGFFQPQVERLLLLQTVEVGVKHQASCRLVRLQQGEGRTRYQSALSTLLVVERLDDRTRHLRLSRSQRALQQQQSTLCHQCRESFRKCVGKCVGECVGNLEAPLVIGAVIRFVVAPTGEARRHAFA